MTTMSMIKPASSNTWTTNTTFNSAPYIAKVIGSTNCPPKFYTEDTDVDGGKEITDYDEDDTANVFKHINYGHTNIMSAHNK